MSKRLNKQALIGAVKTQVAEKRPGLTKADMEAVLDALGETLRNELVKEEELNLVRNYMIGGLLGDLDGPFQIISRWKSYVLNGLTEDYFYHSINSIKSVTAEELQVLAKKYLNPEEFYELVVI